MGEGVSDIDFGRSEIGNQVLFCDGIYELVKV